MSRIKLNDGSEAESVGAEQSVVSLRALLFALLLLSPVQVLLISGLLSAIIYRVCSRELYMK